MTKQSSEEVKRLALAPTDKVRITFSPRDFSELSKVLGGAFKPNPALKAAVMAAKKLVRRSCGLRGVPVPHGAPLSRR